MTTDRKDFYVYHHIDKLGRIRYIGSGTGSRFKDKTPKLRSKDHVEIWDSLSKVIVKSGLSKMEARNAEQCDLDMHWNTGILLNKYKTVAIVQPILYQEMKEQFYICEESPSGLRRKVDVYFGRKFSNIIAKAGDIAGCKPKSGSYYYVKSNRRRIAVHRVIWCLANQKDVPVDYIVDHIDHDPTNNSVGNLRLVTQSENNRNRRQIKPTISGVLGVNWSSKGYWVTHWKEGSKRQSCYFLPKCYYPDLPTDVANILCKELAILKREEMVKMFPECN